tara:strand:- start:42 stop:896 length:855 start_codon:yes stop_codon:yes gene_type:complete
MWSKNLKKNIIGIPLKKNVNEWQSSTPMPEDQLSDLKSKGFVGDFKDYEKDQNLAKLIEGKKIAVVGPSPHLEGLNYGEKIDSYDIVIRLNQKFAIPENKYKDFGSKTDIMFGSFNHLNVWECNQNKDYIKSLKLLVCPMLSMWDLNEQNKWFDATGVPYHNVCDGYLFKIFKEVGTICNTGFASLIVLLNYKIEELFLTGMTFFDMDKWGNVYFDEYYDSIKAATGDTYGSWNPDRLVDARASRSDIHVQKPQINYFKKIIRKYHLNPLYLDDYLKEKFLSNE